MQTLVTGGTGFVGSHVVRALVEAGHQVRVLHRTSSKLTALEGLAYESAIGDVTDLDSMRQAFAGCERVFHVAAVSDYWRSDPDWIYEVNVEGTRKVLQAARETGVERVVFTGSAAAVGIREDGQPADESVPFSLSPEQFPYGHSKVLAEEVVKEAVADGQHVVTVNPCIVMGPGDLNLISGAFVVQTSRWQWLIPYTSGGIGVIDVRDVARYHLAAAESGIPGERYILCTENYTFHEWYDLIASVTGRVRPRLYTPDFMVAPIANVVDVLKGIGVPLPIDSHQARLGKNFIYFDGSKAHEAFGPPQISMEQSIADTFAWYQEQGTIREDAITRFVGGMGRLLGLG